MKRIIAISTALILGTAALVVAGKTSQTTVTAPAVAQAQDIAKVTQASNKIETTATALQPTSIVELFTSQGCSSCPPANDFAAKMAQDEEKLVLTYGVTYWDYLGWKDTFGDPQFTARQRNYGKALGTPNIYTPQLILNGEVHSPRYSRDDVETQLLPESKPEADISVADGRLVVRSAADTDSKLIIVSFKPGMHSVDVRRGENRGRTLELANVVTEVMPTMWYGTVLETDIQPKAGQAYAALFHDPKSAAIKTAAVYKP